MLSFDSTALHIEYMRTKSDLQHNLDISHTIGTCQKRTYGIKLT